MRIGRLGTGLVAVAGMLWIVTPAASAYTIAAGITLDIHQDVPCVMGQNCPNDFHIEGMICTKTGSVPQLIQNLGPLSWTFSHTITYVGDCWYKFTADWVAPPGAPGIPFCEIVHIGLLFNITDENTIIDLVGWWTRDGVRVGPLYGNLNNNGYFPVLGFDIAPVQADPVARIGSGFITPIGKPLPILPPGPQPIEVQVTELDVIAFEQSTLPSNWFQELREAGAQSTWPWVPVVNGSGGDINPGNPMYMAPDSFFDIFLEVSSAGGGGGGGGAGKIHPVAPVVVPPNGMLFVRTKRQFTNNAGVPEQNDGLWEWHIHQAQGPEACCFPDGSCQVLLPPDCAARGGFPQGPNTNCNPNICPQPAEACCYPDGSCAMKIAAECRQGGGNPQGVGTTCTPNICPQPPQTGACCFKDGTCSELTPAACQLMGGTPQGLGTTCQTVICALQGPFVLEFSLDIGSDKELSDPQFDGDEAFDPGDVYSWMGPLVNPPGLNGFKDDGARIFGVDPPPTPGLAGSRVPVGNGIPPTLYGQYYPAYFDLDGHDQIDINLEQYIPPTGTPAMIPRFNSACIHEARFLMVSYDDDMPPGWILPGILGPGDVPVWSPSVTGMIYGTTAGQDEVVGVNVPLALPPVPVCVTYPYLAEIGVHQSLALNPDAGNPEDDDVDSLDLVPSTTGCPYYYFTADHEAFVGLDPGHIYLAMAPLMGPIKVVDKIVHLGLLPDTDVRDFEFVWMNVPQSPGPQVLAIVFTVAPDDPVTPNINESGGLNPQMIYWSVFQGWSQPLLQQPLPDNIDGLTAWEQNFGPPLTILSAVSRKRHGTAGSYDRPSGSIEGRINGPTQIVTTFSQPIQRLFLPTGDITVSSGVIGAITIGAPPNDNVLTVDVTGVADMVIFKIGYPGIAAACDATQTTATTKCWKVLIGDANGNGVVNNTDILQVRGQLAQPVGLVNFTKDVNANGVINNTDILQVRGKLGNTVSGICNP